MGIASAQRELEAKIWQKRGYSERSQRLCLRENAVLSLFLWLKQKRWSL
jgi:hypothetical protein